MYSGGGDSNDDVGVADVGGVSTNGGDHTFCIFGVLKLIKLTSFYQNRTNTKSMKSIS